MVTEHDVTQELECDWPKVLAVVIRKYLKGRNVTVSIADMDAAAAAFRNGPALAAVERADGIHLSVVGRNEGERIEKKYGGKKR